MFNAADFGASPAASWTVNRNAFQAAHDAARNAGGGEVTAPPGVYQVKGVVQDGGVGFVMPGVTLRSPDGQLPEVLATRVVTTTGSTTAGGRQLIVASSTGIRVDAVIAVQAAGGILDTQFTRLVQPITATQDSGIALASTTGFPTAGTLQVDSELLTYTGLDGATLTGVTRGAYGTPPAAHTTTSRIGVARRLYALVLGVVGTTVTIDTPALIGAAGVAVSVGCVRPALTGLTVDGNKVWGGAARSLFAVSWPQVRWGRVENVIVRNAENGFALTRGASDCTLVDLHLHDCGTPETAKGSALWMYQGCRRNRARGACVTGSTWTAVYLDDRTTTAQEGWDGPNDDNVISDFTVRITESRAPALAVVGGSHNRFVTGTVSSPGYGVSLSNGTQGTTADGSVAPCRGNEIAGIAFRVRFGWILEAPGNSLHDCYVAAGAEGVGSNAGNNLVYAVSPTPGATPRL
ncbi:hypothetical protein [Micromonospora sagamiensis]|uniref:Pectate lyase-like protein n=1 Tax=Micromonospora sagamiensis TaxID=47875 RepID=A0A562WK92_9ACTN|nr:hypothetical protein [Micromonospora sagamiensis]TWJ30317.1 hypothetical protein JD81_03855 [Micromonospora sagamiensis]BCL16653.1 hypothetical protein GCM10017556_43920 [Micromonospora sagamiensis]